MQLVLRINLVTDGPFFPGLYLFNYILLSRAVDCLFSQIFREGYWKYFIPELTLAQLVKDGKNN